MKIQSLKYYSAVFVLAFSLGLGQKNQAFGQCPSGIAGLSGSVLNSSIQAYPGYPGFPSTAGLAHFLVKVNDNSQPIPQGEYLGWCVDQIGDMNADFGYPPNTFYSGLLYPTCDANLIAELPPGHTPTTYQPPAVWHQVNYLLNHKNGAPFWAVQVAIFDLVGGPAGASPPYPFYDPSVVQSLTNAAIVNAASWTPQCGKDVIGLIYVITSQTAGPVIQQPPFQFLLIEVPYECPPTANCVTINAVQGVAITPVTMVGTGGCGGPYTFSATGLPTGLTMSSGGTISGTPTVSGPFNYTVTITDNCGNTGKVNCSVTVNPPPPTADCATINAVKDVAITPVTLVASGGCGGPYTFSAVGLPSWLSISSGGTISGTPTNSGTFFYTVTITDNCGNTGKLACSVTVCGGQIGDYVWNDVNGNGCQDAGEPGIPGVQVILYSGACGTAGTAIATNYTDSTGHYLFSGLCAGNYQVAITTPSGYTATTPNTGCKDTTQPPYTADRDSKCNCAEASPCITCVTLTAANSVNLNVDCGYVCNGQIGDFVWQDLNGNGCQDAGEPGIAGVTVDLYSGACGTAGTKIATTTTDSTGHYLFSGLCAGDYQVAITTPSGYTATTPNTGCTDITLPPDRNQLDSKCDCAGASPCITCVTLTAANPINLNVDCGYVTPPQPALELVKTASPTNAAPGQAVTYYYAVTNIGNLTITNINIMDDNGTPSDTNDDFNVNAAPFSLDPGQGTTFVLPSISEPLCMSNGGTNLNTGTLTVNVLPNGNVEVFYLQSESLNDNRYGTNATAATGWSGGHKFGDLTGSDEADFRFTDGNGTPVLEFQVDYISQATSAKFGNGVTIAYPSGYGTLGPLGGDGKMIVGASSNVLSARTTFSDTINQSPTFYGYTVNSPKETSPLSGVSIPAGWNYKDGYYVLISSNAFGAAGFGAVTIPYAHNSPAKSTPNKSTPTNVCSCVVNTAVATAYANGALIASDYETAQVCFTGQSQSSGSSGCNITDGALKFDKKTVQLPQIKNNNATVAIYMSELDLSWPATNGNIVEVDLNGKAWAGSLGSPTTLTSADFIASATKIDHGQTKNLVLKFENNVSKTNSLYSGTVKFGTNSTCVINFLP